MFKALFFGKISFISFLLNGKIVIFTFFYHRFMKCLFDNEYYYVLEILEIILWCFYDYHSQNQIMTYLVYSYLPNNRVGPNKRVGSK